MSAKPRLDYGERPSSGWVLHPSIWHPANRHVIVGVSHPSNDPARHRVFEIRAAYDATVKGWVAHAAEQNLNEQRGDWAPVGTGDQPGFATAAECLGQAVAAIVSSVDDDAGDLA